MNLHTDVTETMFATRRQLTRVLAVGAVAAAAVAGIAVPAQAADFTNYHVAGARGAGASVVADPNSSSSATIATLSNGTTLTIDCGIRGRSVNRNSVWHHITSPVSGYIADYYTDTPGFDQFLRREATCSTAPVTNPPSTSPTTTPTTSPTTTPTTSPSAPAATRGQTINYNEGYAGSCVFYALDMFHKLTGAYPKAFGDAKYLATESAKSGWTVGNTPRVNSMVVFQPGQNGAAAPTGHIAWVEQISGDRIYISEMNAPQAYVVTRRWLTPVSGVKYIYAP